MSARESQREPVRARKGPREPMSASESQLQLEKARESSKANWSDPERAKESQREKDLASQ